MKQKTKTFFLMAFLAASAVHLFLMFQDWSSPDTDGSNLLQGGDGDDVLLSADETDGLQSSTGRDTLLPPAEGN